MPTVVIGTDEFEKLIALERRSRGLAALPYALTRHPIGGLKPDQMPARVDAMLEQVLAAVLAPVAGGAR